MYFTIKTKQNSLSGRGDLESKPFLPLEPKKNSSACNGSNSKGSKQERKAVMGS